MASAEPMLKNIIWKAEYGRLPTTAKANVLNTYRVWLRYELFRGGLSYEAFRASEDNLMQFINMRGNAKPHLTELVVRD
jgi:Predicted 3'-5' exonuclease related to the exonuclease domain of PolB